MKRTAFKNPTRHQLDQMDLQVSDRKFRSALDVVARQLGTRFVNDVLPLPSPPRTDPTYPTGLRVLYRKFGFDCGEPGSSDGGCLSFDVIPVGVAGDPRRYRTYRSFQGSLEEGEELFKKLLQFLYRVVQTVHQHQRL